MQTLNLKWIIAHKPVYLFQRVAEDFKRLVNSKSKNVNIDIEILTAEEFNSKYQPAEPATRHNLWKFLQDNTVQIAQMQTTSLARLPVANSKAWPTPIQVDTCCCLSRAL